MNNFFAIEGSGNAHQCMKEHEKLEICKVDDIFDAEKLKQLEILNDVDVVMSTLGFGRGST